MLERVIFYKETGLKKLKTYAEEKREKINDEIEDTNHQSNF